MKYTTLIATFLLAGFTAFSASAAPIETLAKHAFITDVNTGAVLMNKAADVQMPTSSMSKTMTLYMVFDALKKGQLKLTDELPVSEKAWREGGSASGGSTMFLKVGSSAKVEDLIRGVAIQSGNDATIVLAEGIAGTEETFAERMTLKAKELGMNNSQFKNASGLPVEGHYSTARDLALLAQRLVTDFPEYYPYFSEKEFVYNKIRQQNRDPLLGKVAGADGIKTGHTEVAGYGLIGSAKRGERRIVMVINGLSSTKERAEEGAKLMEWAFRNFEDRKVLSAGQAVGNANVWQGVAPEVPLVADKDVVMTVPAGRGNETKMTIVYKGPLPAPIKKGDAVAKLRILAADQEPMEVSLLAGADVERQGLFGRVGSRLRYLLHGS